MPYSIKSFLEIDETMIDVLLVLYIFSHKIRNLKICSVVLLPARKPACSSAMMFSASGFSLFRITVNITLLGWLIRLMVR